MADSLNYTDPRGMMADRYASQYTPLSGSLDEMTIQLGGNAGSLLGNALFGGQSSAMMEQRAINDAIKEADAAEDPDERLSLFAKALRKRGLEGRAQEVEDKLLDRRKTVADIGRLNRLGTGGAGGGGTGPERMAQHVSKVQTALAAGEPVSEQDKNLAVAYTGILSKNQFFKQEDGSIVGVDKNDFSRIGDLIRDGAVEIPVGIPSPTAPSTQAAASTPVSRPAPSTQPARSGARVIETPASEEARKKAQQGIQNQIDTISADLDNINEASNLVSSRSAGWAGALGVIPQTDARRVQKLIEGIDAAKVFNELTKLREASASGASGLGQVTEREISLLQNRLRVLDPYGDPTKLKDDLQYVAKAWKDIQDKLKASQTPEARSKDKPTSNNQDEALIQRWMSANPRATREQVINGLKKRGLIK
jgi:hypothetical protein